MGATTEPTSPEGGLRIANLSGIAHAEDAARRSKSAHLREHAFRTRPEQWGVHPIDTDPPKAAIRSRKVTEPTSRTHPSTASNTSSASRLDHPHRSLPLSATAQGVDCVSLGRVTPHSKGPAQDLDGSESAAYRKYIPVLTPGGLLTCTAAPIQAQVTEPAPEISISEIGPHSRVWETVIAGVDESGNPAWETNSYTELCPGLYYEPDGKWVESRALVEPCANGAAAVHGQHQALVANNLKSLGAIELVMPDGQRLRCTPRFLAYVDPVAGKQELLAEVKDCQGALAPPNQVLDRDCLDSLKATLRYTYRVGGFESDVIREESPTPPEKFGRDPATTRREFWTEWNLSSLCSLDSV